MIVLGLDGATWTVIKPNLHSLPAFAELLRDYEHSTLECDVRPVHSGPSWTTAFSGLLPERHGITGFVMDNAAREALIAKRMFVWDKVRRAIVMGVPIALPPLNVNYEMHGWEKSVLAIKEGEMYESTERLAADVRAALEYGNADLVVAVFSEPDRAQHLFWRRPELVLKHYQSIDRALGGLLPHLKGKEFLIMSDHGFTDAEETRRNGWDTVRQNQTGGHHPDGIAIASRDPPLKISKVCAFIEEGLGI